MRVFYTLLWYVALPFLPLRLWRRSRREPGYRVRIGERFGRYDNAAPLRTPVLWIHAVSLGETRAAIPLVDRITRALPDATVLMTHMTATGRAAGHALFGERVVQAWLPYDVPFAIRGFLEHWRPQVALIMETELWPNLVALAHRAGVPVYLVNGRMSAKSAAGYARVPSLTRPMLEALAGVAAQSADDAARFEALGARAPLVTGNLKFDLDVPVEALSVARELRRSLGDGRPVWLAGSTRDAEEALILDALSAQPLPPDVLTVIVPRHPQRFDAVADLLRQRGIPFVRRTRNVPVPLDVRVMLGDTMGEMLSYCAAADVVFVGGSLLPLGGHNLIDPIAVGTPVLVGPHTFNFSDATAGAIAAGAALRVQDAAALVAAIRQLLADPGRRKVMGDAARAFHGAHRGAADRLWAWLAPRLPSG